MVLSCLVITAETLKEEMEEERGFVCGFVGPEKKGLRVGNIVGVVVVAWLKRMGRNHVPRLRELIFGCVICVSVSASAVTHACLHIYRVVAKLLLAN